MHIKSPDGKHTLCDHTGKAAGDSTADIEQADCLTCLWGLVKLLHVQMSATLARTHKVERSKTIPV
jgi:hypothetical protein